MKIQIDVNSDVDLILVNEEFVVSIADVNDVIKDILDTEFFLEKKLEIEFVGEFEKVLEFDNEDGYKLERYTADLDKWESKSKYIHFNTFCEIQEI